MAKLKNKYKRFDLIILLEVGTPVTSIECICSQQQIPYTLKPVNTNIESNSFGLETIIT